ncbi:MAG TPA: response regulator [Thermoanaerobaculia bacterium]|nr:response regulator [Thermoanaerobaculia bacterium]
MGKDRYMVAVVDDEESVRRALARLFRSAGLDVETYASGAAFLESLDTHSPDCVLLDLHMPSLNGFDVQARLGKRVPVIVLTGHDTGESYKRAILAGAAAYLRKPVDDRTLLDTIAAVVDVKSGGGAGPH